MDTEFPSFEETYSPAISEDDERIQRLRARLAVPLDITDPDLDGYIPSGGVTVQWLGVDNMRVNMKIEVMEKILDYFDDKMDTATTQLQELYELLDNR